MIMTTSNEMGNKVDMNDMALGVDLIDRIVELFYSKCSPHLSHIKQRGNAAAKNANGI
jgi:hypothetical protein